MQIIIPYSFFLTVTMEEDHGLSEGCSYDTIYQKFIKLTFHFIIQ